MKPENIVRTILIQLALVPLIHFVLYHIALQFHPQTYVDLCMFCGGPSIIIYLYFIFIVFVSNVLIYNFIPNKKIAFAFHLLILIGLVYSVLPEISFQPYEIGLQLFCICLTLPIRMIVERKIN